MMARIAWSQVAVTSMLVLFRRYMKASSAFSLVLQPPSGITYRSDGRIGTAGVKTAGAGSDVGSEDACVKREGESTETLDT